MEHVRWGIIGCGDVTEVKSGPGLQKARNSSLVAVMRRNGELAADYARRHGVPRWYNDARALIRDPQVDAVYVATPPDSHHTYALMAAAAGKPVYVEKPMARSHAECLEMIQASRSAGVPLWVAYYRRRLPKFLKIEQLLADGAIGAVRGLTIRFYQRLRPELAKGEARPWRVVPEIAGGGLFVDLASHMLDIADYLMGPIQAAQGFAGNQAGAYAAEDTVTGSWLFESGVQGTGIWSFVTFENVDEMVIEGDQGRLCFSCFDSTPIIVENGAGRSQISAAQPQHVQQPLIQAIVDELTGGPPSPSTGVSAARTSWVMDQMLAGYYGTGT